MTYDQYQQLYNAAKEQIADRVAKIQPRAGNGASVNGMGISIEVGMAEEVVGQVGPVYYILAWLGQAGSFDNAGRYTVGPDNEVNAAFPFDMGAQDPFSPLDPALVQPLVLTLQFIASTSSGSEYFPFPVQVTLVQYSQRIINQDQEYREVPLRTVTVDLRGSPVTTTFYYDFNQLQRGQIVRLTELTKI
jgi:hypothetical protein